MIRYKQELPDEPLQKVCPVYACLETPVELWEGILYCSKCALKKFNNDVARSPLPEDEVPDDDVVEISDIFNETLEVDDQIINW